MENRNYKIDCLKGVAAFLVVVGHVIQSGDPNFDSNHLFKIIYSFHMPLFMFLSGYVAYYTFQKKLPWTYCIKRFLQLMIPFLIWGFLSIAVKSTLSLVQGQGFPLLSHLKELILVPEHGLWFLLVLFIFNILHFLIVSMSFKFNNRLRKCGLLLIWATTFLLFALPFPNVFCLVNISKLLPFYVIGYYVNLAEQKGFNSSTIHNNTLRKKIFVFIGVTLLLLFSIILTVVREKDFIIDIELVKENYWAWVLNKILLFLISLIWVFALFCFVGYLKKQSFFTNVLGTTGKYSLDIYALQLIPIYALGIIFNKIHPNVVLLTYVLSPLIALSLSVLLIIISKYVIRKIGFLAFLLLGYKKPKRQAIVVKE